MSDLSQRQADVLDFVVQAIEPRGLPPSYREIGDALGIASTNGVSDHVKALIKKVREDTTKRAEEKFDHVVRAYRSLKPQYRSTIKDITRRMAEGMMLFTTNKTSLTTKTKMK